MNYAGKMKDAKVDLRFNFAECACCARVAWKLVQLSFVADGCAIVHGASDHYYCRGGEQSISTSACRANRTLSIDTRSDALRCSMTVCAKLTCTTRA